MLVRQLDLRPDQLEDELRERRDERSLLVLAHVLGSLQNSGEIHTHLRLPSQAKPISTVQTSSNLPSSFFFASTNTGISSLPHAFTSSQKLSSHSSSTKISPGSNPWLS